MEPFEVWAQRELGDNAGVVLAQVRDLERTIEEQRSELEAYRDIKYRVRRLLGLERNED
uniref:Uncharacterized protein n=1 Tax=viral metagenome TaxID=1070528 RepID=A0A6M3XZY9_9ZZZZ